MTVMLGPVDVTENNPETYTSSHLAQFAWTEDPKGTAGILYVQFKHGGEYVYIDADEEYWSELRTRAHYPNRFEQTAGEYFANVIKEKFDRKGLDYAEFDDVLN